VHKSPHAAGSTHDYGLYKHSHPKLSKEVKVGMDLGYLGVATDFPEFNCELPFKGQSPGRVRKVLGLSRLGESKNYSTSFYRLPVWLWSIPTAG
jgi:hypothetical protein